MCRQAGRQTDGHNNMINMIYIPAQVPKSCLARDQQTGYLDGLHVEGPVTKYVPAHLQVGDASPVFPSRQIVAWRTRRKCQNCGLYVQSTVTVYTKHSDCTHTAQSLYTQSTVTVHTKHSHYTHKAQSLYTQGTITDSCSRATLTVESRLLKNCWEF